MQDFSGTGILYFEGYIHTMYRMESLLNSFSAFKRYLFLFLSEQSSHDIVSSSLFRLECPQNQGLTHLCNTHEHCAWHTCRITLPNPKGTFLLLNFSGAFDSRELTDHFLMFSFCVCDPTLSCFFLFFFFSPPRSLAVPFQSPLQCPLYSLHTLCYQSSLMFSTFSSFSLLP